MEVIRTENYLDHLRNVANSYAFPLEQIEAVPNIKEWCDNNGIPEENPYRVGKCLKNSKTKKYRILIVKEITPDMISSVINVLEYNGFENEVANIKENGGFLLHLMLHEIAHAMHPAWSENECDLWAFKEWQSNPLKRMRK